MDRECKRLQILSRWITTVKGSKIPPENVLALIGIALYRSNLSGA